MYCSASDNKCHATALPSPPKLVTVVPSRVAANNQVQATITQPENGPTATHYSVVAGVPRSEMSTSDAATQGGQWIFEYKNELCEWSKGEGM